ncbi:MAG TPA: DUF6785 family protein, partial [Armatimonadota bacterium]|nr:DUF6785 family protein [Armatimonadota bacterium]
EIVLQGTQIGSFAPPAGALLVLFSLCALIDPILRLVTRRKHGLERRELLAVYIALLATATLPSCQFAGWLPTITSGPFYFASEVNHWGDAWRHIPEWWGPRAPGDAEAIRQFYEGLSPGAGIQWGVWLKPLASFGPMVLALYAAFMALSVVLGRQWVDREKLSFPLAQLPLELTERSSEQPLWTGFFRSRMMWLGALVPMACHTVNGLHRFFPAVPEIPLRGITFGSLFAAKPWVAAQPVRIDIYFGLVGFAFLCSRDVPMSIWVFWALAKLEAVFGCALGWNPGPPGRALRDTQFPVIVAQQVGASLMFLGLMLWAARAHLREVWLEARTQTRDGRRYRLALGTVAVSFVVLCAWSVLGGMQWWVAICLWALTLAFMLVVHRMMAEGGVNLLWASQSAPNYLLYTFDGGRFLGPRTWMQLVSLPYFIWHFKGAVGPHSFEGLKLASEAGLSRRGLFWLMGGSMVAAAVVGYASTIFLVMRNGGGVALYPYLFVHVGHRPLQEFVAVTGTPEPIRWQKIAGMLASGGLTWGLSWMRWQFSWWRLHPIGYVISTVAVNWYLWSSCFIGSTLNAVVHRYAGHKGYRGARPFFLGLIFGDMLMLGIWTVVTAITGERGFMLFAA